MFLKRGKILSLSIILIMFGAIGCASNRDLVDKEHIDPIHPVTLSTRNATIGVTIGQNGSIQAMEKTKLMDYAASFYRLGGRKISVKSKTANSAQISTVISVLRSQGIRSGEIESSSANSGSGSAKAVKLSFKYFDVRPSPCGRFTNNPGYNPRNLTELNFGCSVRNNIAIMTSNPNDIKAATIADRPGSEPAINQVQRYRAQ